MLNDKKLFFNAVIAGIITLVGTVVGFFWADSNGTTDAAIFIIMSPALAGIAAILGYWLGRVYLKFHRKRSKKNPNLWIGICCVYLPALVFVYRAFTIK